MPGEKQVAEAASGTVAEIVLRLFSGGHESVIAVLILVVLICLAALWFMFKRLQEKDALINKLMDEFRLSQDKHWGELKNLTDKYIASVKEINEQVSDDVKSNTEALNGMRVVMAETKTTLSILFNQAPRN